MLATIARIDQDPLIKLRQLGLRFGARRGVRLVMEHRNVFICGHPRSASTHLYYSLRLHPEFRNEKYFDKESKFFSSIIGERHWGRSIAVNMNNSEDNMFLDEEFVNRTLKTVHAFVSEYLGGRNGRFLNAYPYDIACMDRIHRADPSSKFIVLLREPVGNIWSMLNYPLSREWIPNTAPDAPHFHKDDVWTNALRWAIPIWTAAQQIVKPNMREAMLIIRHEEISTDAPKVLLRIFNHLELEPDSLTEQRFLGISGMENTQIHSSHFKPDENIETSLAQEQQAQVEKALQHPEMVDAIRHYLNLTKGPREILDLDWDI